MKRVLLVLMTVLLMVTALSALATETYTIEIRDTIFMKLGDAHTQWNRDTKSRALFAACCLYEMQNLKDMRLTNPFLTANIASISFWVGDFVDVGTIMLMALEQEDDFIFIYFDFIYTPGNDKLTIALKESVFMPDTELQFRNVSGWYLNYNQIENQQIWELLEILEEY